MKPFIYPSSMETARALILHLIKIMIDEPGKTFNFAFSGGSTPALMFDLWANEYSDITPWTRMRVYFVDERCVPPENSDSNYGMMRSLLVGVVPIPYENVFRIKGEERPEKEAVRYSRMVENNIPMKDGWPVFDVVLLGAGGDGHTSSIFPGQESLLSSDKIYEVNFVTKDLAKDGICMFSATEWNYNLRVMSRLLIDNNISKKHKIMILENAVAAYNGEAKEIALTKYMGAYKDKHL